MFLYTTSIINRVHLKRNEMFNTACYLHILFYMILWPIYNHFIIVWMVWNQFVVMAILKCHDNKKWLHLICLCYIEIFLLQIWRVSGLHTRKMASQLTLLRGGPEKCPSQTSPVSWFLTRWLLPTKLDGITTWLLDQWYILCFPIV